MRRSHANLLSQMNKAAVDGDSIHMHQRGCRIEFHGCWINERKPSIRREPNSPARVHRNGFVPSYTLRTEKAVTETIFPYITASNRLAQQLVPVDADNVFCGCHPESARFVFRNHEVLLTHESRTILPQSLT